MGFCDRSHGCGYAYNGADSTLVSEAKDLGLPECLPYVW